MRTLHEILSRIRWDPTFGDGDFWLAYHDRIEDRLVRIPFGRVVFGEGNRFGFTVIDPDGTPRTVPFHRVRRVWKNGELIWSRDG